VGGGGGISEIYKAKNVVDSTAPWGWPDGGFLGRRKYLSYEL
jgi:hypothetical protein